MPLADISNSPSRAKRHAHKSAGPALQLLPAQNTASSAAETVLWSGWLRKLSGAKQSGTRRKSLGGLMKKWDQRWFKVTTIQIGADKRAFIEWHKDSAGSSAKGSFCLSGSILTRVEDKNEPQYKLLLPPTEQNKEEHQLILRASGYGSVSDSEFDGLLQVLRSWGVLQPGSKTSPQRSEARAGPPQMEGLYAQGHGSAARAPTVAGSRAQFVRAVMAAAAASSCDSGADLYCKRCKCG